MTFVQVLIFIAVMTILPVGMGFIFPAGRKNPMLSWVLGFILMWVVTYIFALPLIIKEKSLTLLLKAVSVGCVVIFLAGIAAFIIKRNTLKFEKAKMLTLPEILYLGIFLGLLLFQLYKTIAFAYTDGDDAFYVAVSQNADAADSMYLSDPYSGNPFLQSKRYYFAPFPMWIAMLARLTKINAAAVAHTLVPVALIPVTYVIYNEIGKAVFGKSREKRYMFLSLFSVFALFSGVSYSTAERFMLTRTRQGKEALANIIIPLVVLLFLRITKKQPEETKKNDLLSLEDTALLLVIGIAGALTSLMSNVLTGILLLCLFVYSLAKKASFKTLIKVVAAAVPEALVLLLYLVVK